MVFCKVLNDLTDEQLRVLAEVGLFEHLIIFLETNDPPIFVSKLLLDFSDLSDSIRSQELRVRAMGCV
jgi:hypothetical protein